MVVCILIMLFNFCFIRVVNIFLNKLLINILNWLNFVFIDEKLVFWNLSLYVLIKYFILEYEIKMLNVIKKINIFNNNWLYVFVFFKNKKIKVWIRKVI